MFQEIRLTMPVRVSLPLILKISKIVVINIALMMGLCMMDRYNFLLYHSFIEILCVITSIGIFIVTLNSIEFRRDDFFLVIGYAYLFVGIFDFIHLLSYKGMSIFIGSDISLSTQLWIMGRYIESLALLIALLSFYRKVNIRYLIAIFSIITMASLVSIFYMHNFPVTFLEGTGLTPIKVYSEYLICLIFGTSIYILTKNRDRFETSVYKNLIFFASLAIIAELIFSSYIDLFGTQNTIGHYLKILSYYFLYRAVFVTGIKTPYYQLNESNNKYETLTRLAPVGIFNMDELGNILYVNKQIVELTSLTKETLIEKGWIQAVHPADQYQVYKQWNNTIETGSPFRMEIRFQSSGGRIKWAQCLIDAQRDDEDNIIGFIGTLLDITDRRLAVEMMFKSEKLYRMTFEDAPVGFAHTDIEGKFIKVNKKICEILGYTQEEILNITRHSLLFSEDMEQDNIELSKLTCADVSSISMEQRYIRFDKRVIYVSLKITIVTNDPAYYIIIMDDITQKKDIERQILKSLDEKRLMLGEIHHRVKNNLAVVDGLLKMQSLSVKDVYFKGLLQDCQNRICSIALVHEKLYQSKSIAEISFKSYIDSLIIRMRGTYSKDIERIKINNNMTKEVYFGIDTATPLGLIINEIITNAIKHAFGDHSIKRDGVIDINLVQFTDDYGDEYFELNVKDNGVGMPLDINTNDSKTLGIRLINGLATSQLNGEISFKNKNGTEIKIRFRNVRNYKES